MKRVWKNLGLLLGLIALVSLLHLLPFREWLQPVFEHLQARGRTGMARFVLLCVLLTVCFTPVSVIIFSAGMLFGLGPGFLLASVVLVAGTSIGFVLGKCLWFRLQHWPIFRQRIFQAVRSAVESEGNGLIALLRMTPVFHFMSGNLFFGSLNLKFGPYMLFSYLGMIPGTLLVVYAGSVANRSLEQDSTVTLWNWILFGAGLLAFTWVSWRITLITRRKLQAAGDPVANATTNAR